MKNQTNQPKQVILLNGPSSGGKSTLALALQKQFIDTLNYKYSIVSIDDFMKLRTDETIYEDDIYEISGDMCKAALADLKKHDGVIIDHVITSERIFNQLNEMLDPNPILLVHVTAPLSVLKEREKARGDRCIGSAESSYEYLYPRFGYDVTVDTYFNTPKMSAMKIIYEKVI